MRRPELLGAAIIVVLFTVGVVSIQEPVLQAEFTVPGDMTTISAVVVPEQVAVSDSLSSSPGVESGTALSPAVRLESILVTPTPLPVDGDCDSWATLLARYGIPYDATTKQIMWRESRCSFAVNINPNTGDASYGPLQVNRHGAALRNWWDEAGYTEQVMSTVEGSVAAAGVLYGDCGWGPWTRPYSCDGSYQQTARPAWGEW